MLDVKNPTVNGIKNAKKIVWKIPLCFTKMLNSLGKIGMLLLILLFGWSISGSKDPKITKAKKIIVFSIERKFFAINPAKIPKAK